MSGFHGAFATGVASQQGTLTLPDTWFRPPFWDLLMLPIVETKFLELAMSLLDFSPRIPLGTFSILLCRTTFVLSIKTTSLFIRKPSVTTCITYNKYLIGGCRLETQSFKVTIVQRRGAVFQCKNPEGQMARWFEVLASSMPLLDFSPRIPLGTFSILLCHYAQIRP